MSFLILLLIVPDISLVEKLPLPLSLDVELTLVVLFYLAIYEALYYEKLYDEVLPVLFLTALALDDPKLCLPKFYYCIPNLLL